MSPVEPTISHVCEWQEAKIINELDRNDDWLFDERRAAPTAQILPGNETQNRKPNAQDSVMPVPEKQIKLTCWNGQV